MLLSFICYCYIVDFDVIVWAEIVRAIRFERIDVNPEC